MKLDHLSKFGVRFEILTLQIELLPDNEKFSDQI